MDLPDPVVTGLFVLAGVGLKGVLDAFISNHSRRQDQRKAFFQEQLQAAKQNTRLAFEAYGWAVSRYKDAEELCRLAFDLDMDLAEIVRFQGEAKEFNDRLLATYEGTKETQAIMNLLFPPSLQVTPDVALLHNLNDLWGKFEGEIERWASDVENLPEDDIPDLLRELQQRLSRHLPQIQRHTVKFRSSNAQVIRDMRRFLNPPTVGERIWALLSSPIRFGPADSTKSR